MTGIEELEEQILAKGGRTDFGRPHEALGLVQKIVKYQTEARFIYFLPPPGATLFGQISKSWKHPP